MSDSENKVVLKQNHNHVNDSAPKIFGLSALLHLVDRFKPSNVVIEVFAGVNETEFSSLYVLRYRLISELN